MSEDGRIYHKFKADDIAHFIDNDLYLPTRTIYMGSAFAYDDGGESGVDHAMAERLIKTLHILDSKAPKGDKPITIIMNNPGGDEYHGLAIFDAIENCKNQVKIHVYGHAMSMGSILLQAADERLMSKNSRIMIHYGTFGVHDHSKTSYKWSDEGKKFDVWMEDLFLMHMEGTELTAEEYADLVGDEPPTGNAKRKKVTVGRPEIKRMLNFDTFITADMALKFGLIDGILNDETEYEDYEE